MNKVYKIAAILFLGVSIGLFIGAKFLGVKTVYSGKMRLKQKGRSHTMTTDVDIAIENTKKQLKEKRKELRKKKREGRKADK